MFKNWKAICRIPDREFKWAMVRLDLNTAFGRKVVKRFPEFFATKSTPIPLSVLTDQRWRHTQYVDQNLRESCRHFSIPMIHSEDEGAEDLRFPKELRVGAEIKRKGVRMVQVSGHLYAVYVPAAMVDLSR